MVRVLTTSVKASWIKKMKCLFIFFSLLSINGNCHAATFLVFGGKTGWIGQKVVKMLQEREETVFTAVSRLENRESIEKEISEINPDFIINCAGVTGIPNIDWCEDHQIETLRANVIGTLNLIDVAYLRNIPVTNFSSGCIYEYDEFHPVGSGVGFTEEERPNYEGSFYSITKGIVERLLISYPNLLNLRPRMPLTSDLNPKNLIVKLLKYKKVINVPNSMTILDDLLPIAIDMTLKGYRGTYNFVNPGTISHNELLDLYKRYIDPSFVYENFSIEEQNQFLKAKRSNNELDVKKLLKEYPNIPDIKHSIHTLFQKLRDDT